MKKYLAICSLIAAVVVVLAACHKVADLPYYNDGNAVTLTANKNAVTATATDSITDVISFSWSNPNYAIDSSTAKYILEIDSSGNFTNKVSKTVVGARTVSLTGKELNGIVLGYGYNIGTAKDLNFRIVSSYGNNNDRYISNVVKIAVTPYKDSSVLTSTKTSVTGTIATQANPSLAFNWSRSFNGYSGVVNYVLQYDSAGKNFANLDEIAVGGNILTKAMTEGEMNETALNSGIPGGNSGRVEYRIKATTAQGAIVYSNVISVTIQSYQPILRFYMPGGYQAATGNGVNWDPPTAPEFIRDLRPGLFNNMYYMYIYLPAGSEFKITEGRSWTTNYGPAGGNNLTPGGGNFSVATSGYYRISFNRQTLKYDIREGRMGFVGGATGAGWNPPNVFPTYAMGAVGTNLFVGLTDLTVDAWKMIDNNVWNTGSNLVDETRSYGSAGGSGSTLEINTSTNMPNPPSAGRYRVIWDGRDRDNVKYEMSPATMMKVVGNGIDEVGVLDWNPASSPLMTYSGNGVWTIVIKLKADKEIKFLAGADWGAFDYEDNSGGLQSVGVPRAIKWDGGGNFKTPLAAGTYTITLNEHTQTVTIN